ncbi:hypothetical protein Tco_0027821, partial [Tanacetum coccineum]
MSSMGELTFFLGLQVKQQPEGIFISQDKYVADILKKFDFCSIKTANTPIESNKPLVKDEDGVDVDVHIYRSMIGSLMYLTASRPDIVFAVYSCARFQTATVKTLANGTPELVASIDNKEYTITEASVRSTLQLEDAACISNLPDAEIYDGLATLGGYAGEHVPLLHAMLAGAAADQGEGLAIPAEPHHTPNDPIPSTSQPLIPFTTE